MPMAGIVGQKVGEGGLTIVVFEYFKVSMSRADCTVSLVLDPLAKPSDVVGCCPLPDWSKLYSTSRISAPHMGTHEK